MRKRVPSEELEMLHEVPLFSACSRHELREIAKLGTPLEISAGTVFTREGSYGNEFFIVLEGTAGVEVGGRLVAELGPGEYFGELALIDGGARTATVTAGAGMRVLALDAREFHSLVAVSPSIAEKLLVHLASRVRAAEAPIHG